MARTLLAAAAYFLIVFSLGFVLGTARVLLLIPRIGEAGAVVMEAPLMLTASWFAARRCIRWFAVGPGAGERLAMGLAAFGMVMIAEPILSVLIFDQSPARYLAALASPAGLLGLAMQTLFALIPYLQRRGR